jgi:hypothetical protein
MLQSLSYSHHLNITCWVNEVVARVTLGLGSFSPAVACGRLRSPVVNLTNLWAQIMIILVFFNFHVLTYSVSIHGYVEHMRLVILYAEKYI